MSSTTNRTINYRGKKDAMKTIDNPDQLYWLGGQDKHGAIIATGESGTRILVQRKGHPGKHVALEVREFDDLVRFVEENRKEISETINPNGNRFESQKRQDRAMARRTRRMNSFAPKPSTLHYSQR